MSTNVNVVRLNRWIISVTSMKSQTGGKTRVDSAFLVKFLEDRRTPIIKKKIPATLSYRGIKEDHIYFKKKGRKDQCHHA